MQDLYEGVTQPVLIGCFYKCTRSNLIVLAQTPNSGTVLVADLGVYEEYRVGDYLTELPRFNDKEEWEYLTSEIVICNPVMVTGKTSEVETDDA